MEVSGQLHAPGVRAPQYPMDRRLGGPQSQSGHSCEEKKNYIIASAGNQTLLTWSEQK